MLSQKRKQQRSKLNRNNIQSNKKNVSNYYLNYVDEYLNSNKTVKDFKLLVKRYHDTFGGNIILVKPPFPSLNSDLSSVPFQTFLQVNEYNPYKLDEITQELISGNQPFVIDVSNS